MAHLYTNYAKNTKISHLTSRSKKTGKITGGLQKDILLERGDMFSDYTVG